jgi:hypothetical protein
LASARIVKFFRTDFEFNMRLLFLMISTAIAVIVSLSILKWVLRRAEPLVASAAQGSSAALAGSIAPDRFSASFTIVCGMAMAIGGIAVAATGGPLTIAGGCFVLGLVVAGFMAPSLTTLHNVTWTDEFLDGPSRLFGPSLGRARAKIAWGDIVGAGTTLTSYWYVESRDGRRVYWSYLYKGFGSLTEQLRARCPSLALPAAMR